MLRAGQLNQNELLRLPDREALGLIISQETSAFPEQDIPGLEEILFEDEIQARCWALMEFRIDRIIPQALLVEDLRLPGESPEDAMFARRRVRLEILAAGGIDALLAQAPIILGIEKGFIIPLAGAHLCAIAAREYGRETIRAAVGYDRELGFRLREIEAWHEPLVRPEPEPNEMPEPA